MQYCYSLGFFLTEVLCVNSPLICGISIKTCEKLATIKFLLSAGLICDILTENHWKNIFGQYYVLFLGIFLYLLWKLAVN